MPNKKYNIFYCYHTKSLKKVTNRTSEKIGEIILCIKPVLTHPQSIRLQLSAVPTAIPQVPPLTKAVEQAAP